MEMTTSIPVRRITHSRVKELDLENLEYGQHISDHMLIADYDHGKWSAAQVLPFANLSINPAALGLHYGQTVFEGMKAFRMKDGRISIFRLHRHYDRFVKSLQRMCMAIPPRDLFEQGLRTLVDTDRDWVPARIGSSLYLRPFMYASEARAGLKVAEEYRFVIYTAPVPELYAKPIRVKVEQHYIRAARGGTGFAKCGGNYGGAFYPTQLARQEGYDQVLWTDAKDDASIEESGMMNAMFVIDGKLVTPPLSDTILDGVTRDSLLTIAADLGIETEERTIYVRELEQAFIKGKITEAFGAGTAAVVAPIEAIHIKGLDYQLPEYDSNSIHRQLKRRLDDIRYGRTKDDRGWNFVI